MNNLVPHLLWQPVVENAIRHGISRMNGPGVIEIVCKRDEDRLLMEVRDNGPGLPQLHKLRQGVGLTTIRAILDSLYGTSHEFTIHNAPEGGMVASLLIPAIEFRKNVVRTEFTRSHCLILASLRFDSYRSIEITTKSDWLKPPESTARS